MPTIKSFVDSEYRLPSLWIYAAFNGSKLIKKNIILLSFSQL